MYNFNVYILTSLGFCLWCQKCYEFKNLMKLECWQTNFKITIGRTVFRKSCSTSSFAGLGALFDKFYAVFCSRSGASQLASLPSQTKPPYLASQANLASHANLATQANQAGQRNHDRASKLNIRNSTKRRRKASFGWVSGVQPRESRKATKQSKSK